jgi:hypothetical protein
VGKGRMERRADDLYAICEKNVLVNCQLMRTEECRVFSATDPHCRFSRFRNKTEL